MKNSSRKRYEVSTLPFSVENESGVREMELGLVLRIRYV